eukprot:g29813.t1
MSKELLVDDIQKPRVNIDTFEVGQKLQGEVKRVVPFGAFVDVGAYTDGLVHVSKMAKERMAQDYVSEDDEITVWVTSIDSENNKLGLTMVDARAQRSTGTKAEGWSGTKAETNVFCRNGFSMVLAKRSAHSCRVALSFLVLDSMTGRRFRAVFFGGSLGPFSFLSTPRDLDVFDVLRLVAPGRQKGLFSKKKS